MDRSKLLDNYLKQCEETLRGFEALEEYEECAELRDLVKAIKEKDVERYIELSFDLKFMAKVGFFGPTIKKATKPLEAQERIKSYFGLKEIFEYSAVGENRFCPYKDQLRKLQAI